MTGRCVIRLGGPCVFALLLLACSPPARIARPLASDTAKGWQFEVSAVRTYRQVSGGLSPNHEEWFVIVEARARKQHTDARLGELWQAPVRSGGQQTADRWYRSLRLEHCGDGERLLWRLRASIPLDPPLDPRWHLVVASPSVVAVQTQAVTADSCRAALAQAPSVDAWLVAALRQRVERFPTVMLGGAVLGQPEFPSDRQQRATLRISPFLLAAREGRRPAEAIDFALDRLPVYSELVRWKRGRDVSGPFDVLSTERERLVEAVRRDASVGARILEREPPTEPDEVARWFQQLRAAASPSP